jgi:hypothetical protein
MLGLSNSYLCNKFFSELGMGFFIEAIAEINMLYTEKMYCTHDFFYWSSHMSSAVRLLFSYEAEI